MSRVSADHFSSRAVAIDLDLVACLCLRWPVCVANAGFIARVACVVKRAEWCHIFVNDSAICGDVGLSGELLTFCGWQICLQ
jgi:hypothetical protein